MSPAALSPPAAPCRVVPLRAAHRAAWAPLYAAYADFYRVPRLEGAALEKLWEWLTDPADPLRGLLATTAEERTEEEGAEEPTEEMGADERAEGVERVDAEEGEGVDVEEGEVVGAEEGEVVGLAHLCPQRNPLRAGRVMYLHDLFVVPAARGRGVGAALLRAAAAIARTEGCFKMRWATRADNAPAQRLYDQLAERTDWVVYDMNL